MATLLVVLCSRPFIVALLSFCLAAVCRSMIRGKAWINIKWQKPIIASLLALLLVVMLLPQNAYAQLAKMLGSQQPDEEEAWEIQLSLSPVKSPADVFQAFTLSNVKGSEMLNLALDNENYHYKKTTADNLLAAVTDAFSELEQYRSNKHILELHPDISLDGVVPIYDWDDPKSFEGYTAQIVGTLHCLENADTQAQKAELYQKMAIIALNGLYLCRDLEADSQQHWFFAEIAFTALINEYVCMDLEKKTMPDLCYRLGQVYDHLTRATDGSDELRYARNFMAAVFFRISYTEWEDRSFPEEDLTYFRSYWYSNMQLSYRLGLKFQDKQGFFQMVKDCGVKMLTLNPTENSRAIIMDIFDGIEKAGG